MTTELINIYQIFLCRSATEMSSTVIAAFATLWQFMNEPLGFMLGNVDVSWPLWVVYFRDEW